MKQLVLQRLIYEVQKPGLEAAKKLAEMTVAFDRLKENLRAAERQLGEFDKAEIPLRQLFEAAEVVIKATTPQQRQKAISHLRSAMLVAQPHISVIPF